MTENPGSPRRRVYAIGLSDAAGLGMYLALSALFLDQAVKLSSGEIGLVLSASGIASIFGAMPIARMAQQAGLRIGLTSLFGVRALSFIGLSFVNSLSSALVMLTITGLMSRGTAPLIESALIAHDDNEQAVKSLANLRIVRNAGLASGGLPAGLVVGIGDPAGYRYVIIGSGLMFVVAAAICATLQDRQIQTDNKPIATRTVLRDRPFVILTLSFAALTLSAILLGVGLPLWVVNKSDAPRWIVGAIQLLNTVLVVLLQRWASVGTDRLATAYGHMRRGGVLAGIAASAIVLERFGGSAFDAFLIIGVVLLFTLAELFIVAGAEGAALHYIPDGQRPVYLAALNLGFALATVVGPPLAALTVGGAPRYWLVWGAFFAMVAVSLRWIPGPGVRRQPQREASGV